MSTRQKKMILVLLGVFVSGVSLVQAGGFEDWCALYGISADPSGDPDGDGAHNLFEYAYGGDPWMPDEGGYVPVLEVIDIDGTNFLNLIYAMRSEDPELTYTIFENADPMMAPWSPSERWSLDGSEEMPEPGLRSVTNATSVNFAQMTFFVQVERTDTNGVGAAFRSEEMAYPVEGGGGDYELTVVSGSGSGSYSTSDVVDIIADAPAAGMAFYRWVGDTGLLSGSRYSSTGSIDFDFLTYMGYISPPMSFDLEATYRAIQLSSITVSGSSPVNSGSTNSYVCTANYTDGSHSNVTGSAQWSVSGTVATIDATGTLIAGQVAIQEQVTVSASYADGGITKVDTFDVVVQSSNVERDYSYIGGPANPLILSNQVFVGNSGNGAAEIGQIAALEVYDCSFLGGDDGGSGLLIQDVDSVFMTSSQAGCVAQGGNGANVENLEPDAELEAMGGHGIVYSGDPLNITFENITAIGGDGGLVQSFSAIAMEGDASGGCGVLVDAESGFGEHLIRFDGGRYEGGSGGSVEGQFNDAFVCGGDGVVVCGPTNGQVLISDGAFIGGSGGFSFDFSGNADGGSGFVIEEGIATISGGMFSGGQSGLGSSVNGGHGVCAFDSDIEISGGSFMGAAAYDATFAGSGVWLVDNSTAIISGGDFSGKEYSGKLSAGLRVESSSAEISGGNFDSICFASGGNHATFSGSPMIKTLLQIEGTGGIVLSGFSGSIDLVKIESGTMTVAGDPWTLVSGSEIEITEVATLLIGELHALSGSQITTEIGVTFAGTNLTFESGCEWTIDVNGAGVTGVVELATAFNLVSSLAPADLTLLGDGSTYVSSVFTSNSTLYATIEKIPVGFDAWAEGITNVNLRGHADCPDGDDVANLMKYACGLPTGTHAGNLFDFSVFPTTLTNSSAYITITYRKAKNLLDADVYPIQAGTLLGNGSQWTSDGINPWKSGEENGVEIWRASMHGITNGFIRLKAEMVP